MDARDFLAACLVLKPTTVNESLGPPALSSHLEVIHAALLERDWNTCRLSSPFLQSARQIPRYYFRVPWLLMPPLPDVSMPFNVMSSMCTSYTLHAFVFGSLAILLVRKSSSWAKKASQPEQTTEMDAIGNGPWENRMRNLSPALNATEEHANPDILVRFIKQNLNNAQGPRNSSKQGTFRLRLSGRNLCRMTHLALCSLLTGIRRDATLITLFTLNRILEAVH